MKQLLTMLSLGTLLCGSARATLTFEVPVVRVEDHVYYRFLDPGSPSLLPTNMTLQQVTGVISQMASRTYTWEFTYQLRVPDDMKAADTAEFFNALVVIGQVNGAIRFGKDVKAVQVVSPKVNTAAAVAEVLSQIDEERRPGANPTPEDAAYRADHRR